MLVSVVTPSFNQGKFIQRTIDSVLKQVGDDFEVEHIIFDACSDDETLEVLSSYGSKIQWISEADKGQADAVNKGFTLAKGEIIGWLNSDDIYEVGAISKVVQYFQDNRSVDIIYGNASHIDKNDDFIEVYPTEDFNLERLQDTCFICQPTVFFRRQVLEKYGGLNPSLQYCMDYEYWLRLAKNGETFSRINQYLAHSRFYNENKTLGSKLDVHKEICDMFLSMFSYVPSRWITNFSHAKLEKMKLQPSSEIGRIFLLAVVSIAADIYWNKKPSRDTLRSIKRWIDGRI